MTAQGIAETLTEWAEGAATSDVSWHRPSGNYRLRLGKRELLYFYEAAHWVYAIFTILTDTEVAELRRSLSDPSSLHRTKKYWGCQLHSPGDARAVIRVLERRVRNGSW